MPMSTFEADVTFISRSKGGRKSLPLSGTENYSYRPHIVLGDLEQRKAIMDGNVITEPYISVAFHSFPEDLEFNKPFRAELALVFPQPGYRETLIEGATFTLREGATIIGFGTIIRSMDDR